jgi:hypothetical protein
MPNLKPFINPLAVQSTQALRERRVPITRGVCGCNIIDLEINLTKFSR